MAAAALGLLAVFSSACGDHAGSREAMPTADPTGALGLELTLGSGAALTSISYDLTSSASEQKGTILVDAAGASASLFLGALLPGNYALKLSADDGHGTSCSGSTSFSVVAGKTVGVTVPISCRGPLTQGGSAIQPVFDACPEITSLVVAPTAVGIGGKIQFSASASDPDTSDSLQFSWQTSAGAIADSSAQSSALTCSTAGAADLTVTVTDAHGCAATLAASVNCVADQASCGDGVVEANIGEQCDPPNGTSCDSNCRAIAAVCGDGKIEGQEQCEPPGSNCCDATCHRPIAVCGDGVVQCGEACDPPNGVTCGPSCQPLVIVDPDPCPICQQNACPRPFTACKAHEPGCDSILACIESTHCAVGSTRDGAECFCGSLDNDTCFNSFDPTVPQGPCKAQIVAAAGSNVPLQVGQIFFDTSTALGSAMQLTSCVLRSCATACAND